MADAGGAGGGPGLTISRPERSGSTGSGSMHGGLMSPSRQGVSTVLAKACPSDRPALEQLIADNDALRDEIASQEARLAVLEAEAPRAKTSHVRATSVLPGGRTVSIAADELAAMRAIFNVFDQDGDGLINVADLASLHKRLGEPLTDGEAHDAVAMIGGGKESISFEELAAYWDGSHPSLKAGLPEDGVAPEAISKERERKRQWYQARFKFMKAKIANPAVARVFAEPVGPCPSLEFRVFFYYDAGGAEGRVPISPWHDVPLKNADGTYNMLVEIPKWSRRKFEVATGELYNPIKQDVKNGVLREYAYGDQLFNYGCLPQTWEDPKHVSPDTGCGGDNDPLDVVDIGTKMWNVGSIVRVKILGVLGLIDAGETDWKVIAISAEDPLAPLLNDIQDVQVHMPGAVEALHRWLKLYKLPIVNEFAFGGAAMGRDYAVGLVEETHKLWQVLVSSQTSGGAGHAAGAGDGPHAADTVVVGPSHGPVSIASAGLKRSSSKNALQSLLGGAAPIE